MQSPQEIAVQMPQRHRAKKQPFVLSPFAFTQNETRNGLIATFQELWSLYYCCLRVSEDGLVSLCVSVAACGASSEIKPLGRFLPAGVHLSRGGESCWQIWQRGDRESP